MEYEPRHILIIHIAGLAETVLALPALRSLRHHLPQARITVATSAAAANVLRMVKDVDEVLPLARFRGGEWLQPGAVYRGSRSLGELRRNAFDAVIEFRQGPESSLLRRLLKSRPPAPAKGSAALDLVLDRIRSGGQRPPPPHAAQEYLKRLEPWGVRPIESAPRLTTLREADERFDRFLQKQKVQPGELLVGLHPGAGPGKPRWPAERFESIAARLVHNFNARVLLFSGPGERGLAKRIASALPAKKGLPVETPRASDWVSICARLSLFLGHAGGPAHLASAAGAPVLALSTAMEFSPKDLLGPRTETLRAPHIQLISEETVYEAASKLLQINRAEALRTR